MGRPEGSSATDGRCRGSASAAGSGVALQRRPPHEARERERRAGDEGGDETDLGPQPSGQGRGGDPPWTGARDSGVGKETPRVRGTPGRGTGGPLIPVDTH